MDFIIQSASNASLPTEILIIIRSWLFPIITAQLLAQSATALLAYEKSLQNLLCSDCVAYNLDIYGTDIWHWEQFSGPCACLGVVEPGRQGQAQSRSSKQTLPHFGMLNPKQFYDSLQWLEHHLSNETALRTIKYPGYHRSASPDSVLPTSIWDIVNDVLREFNCEINPESDAYNRIERGQSKNKRDIVQIIPLQHDRLESEKSTEIETEIDANWRAYISLRRASRDLGLLLEYPQYFDASRSIASPSTRRCTNSESSDTFVPSFYHHPKDLVSEVFCFITPFAAAFFSLPITFATLTLTILCFYSKPQSFRFF